MAKFIAPIATTGSRAQATPLAGELLYDQDTHTFFYGDGKTVGGIEIMGTSLRDPLGACELGRAETGGVIYMTWRDPDPASASAPWAETVLVKKSGSYPANPKDGEVIARTSAGQGNRDYYAEHAVRGTEQGFFYKLFSLSAYGVWNNLPANEYSAATEATYDTMRACVREGVAPELWPVGTILRVDHSEYMNAQGEGIPFRVVGYDQVEAADPELTHTMCLDMAETLEYFEFDTAELEYALTADDTAQIDKTYYTFSGGVYSPAVLSPGTAITPATYYEKNVAGRNEHGSNNYRTSNIRQFFNSTGAVNAWFSPQTIFDTITPGMQKVNGFAKNINPEFLRVVAKAKAPTVVPTCDGGGVTTSTDRFFLLSQSQVFGGDATEGVQLEFYANGGEKRKHSYAHPDEVRYWWLRSPASPDDAVRAQQVTPMGESDSSYATVYLFTSAACIIA